MFELADIGVDKGGDIIPPMPESSIMDLSEVPTGDEREIRCECNGADSGDANGAFGVDVDTRLESSGPKP